MASLVAGGYRALALPLPHGAFRRFVYAKKHVSKKSSASAEGGEDGAGDGESLLATDRTVYFVNLPRAATDEWLRASLEPAFGAIQHIVFSSAGTGDDGGSSGGKADPLVGRAAHVVFKTSDSVLKVLSAQEIDAEPPEGISGLKAYLAKYKANKPGLAGVKEIADKYMGEFDAQEEDEIRQREELKNQVDADGFVTVVNTKRRSLAAAEEVIGRPAKKQKAKEREDFYRFQMREKKRDQLKSLRERFEEDKQLVDKLKRSNRFKPE